MLNNIYCVCAKTILVDTVCPEPFHFYRVCVCVQLNRCTIKTRVNRITTTKLCASAQNV